MIVVLGVSSGLMILNTVIIIILLVWIVLSQDDFKQGMRKAQVIDLRQENDFKQGHILGARNLPYPYLRQQYGELRKDLPVYLYDEGMTLSTQAAAFLGKHGYNHLYILKDGYRAWDGKTKKSKY